MQAGEGIYDVGYVASAGDTQEFIKSRLEVKDEEIRKAVIGPSDTIVKIKGLPLMEKLVLWSSREEKLDYYTKMDINDYIIILDRIKSYKLKQEVQWELLKVPFDISREELMDTFVLYVEELFIYKEDCLFTPQCLKSNLDDLEIYYQKINMYYSFSKKFGLKFDVDWVYEERLKVSKSINEILVKIRKGMIYISLLNVIN